MTHSLNCKLTFNTVSGFLLVTSGVRIDPGSGTVDLQRTAVEHLGETCPHLRMGGDESMQTIKGYLLTILCSNQNIDFPSRLLKVLSYKNSRYPFQCH